MKRYTGGHPYSGEAREERAIRAKKRMSALWYISSKMKAGAYYLDSYKAFFNLKP